MIVSNTDVLQRQTEGGSREKEERQTDRQTDRDRHTQREMRRDDTELLEKREREGGKVKKKLKQTTNTNLSTLSPSSTQKEE